ncbi:MAG TPA: FtsX-like permease family protein, partial [Gaiellaceae bacterium]|nr:FtsX-like permease family protein [Gaiellaceae bacterium]
VSWVGLTDVSSEPLADIDRRTRDALETVGLEPRDRTLVYRDTRLEGQAVRLAAADRLERWFVLRRGRLPRPCTPQRCETVAVAGDRVPEVHGFPVVGVVEPRGGAAARRLLGTPTRRVGRLVAEDVAGADRLPALASDFRTYTWSAPLSDAKPTAWTLGELERNLTLAGTRLQAASFHFGLNAPLHLLDEVALDARVAYRRLLLVGGECAVLFLVFAVVAASSLRSSALSASRRLRRFGASRWQADLLAGAEAIAIVVPATVLGWSAGALITIPLAAATETPLRSLLARTVLSPSGLALAAVLAALAALVLFLTMRARPLSFRGRGVALVDAAAVAALVAVAVALAVGETDAETLARDRGTGVVLLLVPGLVIVAGAILVARLTGPVFRLAERLAPRTGPSLRLALLSAARNPGTQLVTVGFLVVSVGLAVFAATYRSTLVEGERAEAAYAVPLDYTVRRAAPGRAVGAVSVGAAFAGRDAAPVIRRVAEAPSLDLTETVAVLGLPGGSLQRLRWREDFSETDPAELGRLITPERSLQAVGPRLPPGGEELALPVTVRGDALVVTANVRTEGGTYLVLDLGEARSGRSVLRATLPASAGSGTILGLALEMPAAASTSAAHAAGEGGVPDVFSRGTVQFGRPVVSTPEGRRTVVVDYRQWRFAAEPSRPASTARGSLQVRYLLTQERAFRLRPRQPTDGAPIRVIACDDLADRVGAGGVVPLSIGPAVVNARIVARASLFPTLRCPFVVADVSELETAIGATAPGVAVADEAWIAGPPGVSGSLENAAQGVAVAVTSRRALESELRDDPLARGTGVVLAAGSLLALVLAVLAVLLVVSVELRDERGDYLDLEAQGMAPAALRRQLVLRLGSLALFGVLGGLAIGALLTAVVTELVAVGAGRAAPVPPLRLHVSWPEVALGLLAFAVALAVALGAATRRAFGEPASAGSGER